MGNTIKNGKYGDAEQDRLANYDHPNYARLPASSDPKVNTIRQMNSEGPVGLQRAKLPDGLE
jgi:hypothetical protein